MIACIVCDVWVTRREEGEPSLMAKHEVYCTQWASCGWHGKRESDKLGIQDRPCPKCGKEVTR